MVNPQRHGAEIIVSTGTVGYTGEEFSRLIQLSNGELVVTWGSEEAYTKFGSTQYGGAVNYRLINADSSFATARQVTRLGLVDQTVSSPGTFGSRPSPSMTALSGGRYVLATDWYLNDPTGDLRPSFQIYDATGTSLTGPIYLSAQDRVYGFNENGWDPVVATLSDGRFVVVFRPDNASVKTQIFNADGSAATTGTLVTVNDGYLGTSFAYAYAPSVTALANGGFVTIWESELTDGSGRSIRGRIYDAQGIAAGAEFVVDTTTTADQHAPTVTKLADGRFVVAWVSEDTADGAGSCIRGRVYQANGTPQGSDFVLNTTATGDQLVPEVAALANGGFVAVWLSAEGATGSLTTIRARLFGADGSAQSDFVVNANDPAGTTDLFPTVTALAAGGFAVSWISTDGFTDTVHLQKYDTAATRYDFNANGTSDIILQAGGTVIDWLMQNGAYQSGSVISTGVTGYTVRGSGDFNGDGTADILLQAGGTVVDWIMQNGAYKSGNVVTTGAAGFTVVGVGDVNGDGTSDILVQNGGTVVDWIMQSGVYQSGHVITNAAAGYTVVGAGDFNGDGTSDVLLQSGGTVVDWIMQNGVYQSGGVITTGATGYTVVGTGDFNGDGTADVLLQSGGIVVDWIMKNGVYQTGHVITTAATGFTVVGTGDYNGDGTSDILLQSGGTIVDWIMQNGSYQSGGVITTAALGNTVR